MTISNDPLEELVQLIKNLKTFTNVDTDPIQNKLNILMRDIYDLIVGLESLSRKKRLAILKLAHLFPETLTTVELRKIMEYSNRTSLSYVRQELKDLEVAQLITVKKYRDKKLPFQIQINHQHRLMRILLSLIRSYGSSYREMIKEMVDRND
ncbi:MAG: hypothetical protein ACTSRW_01175 [Candidatus Helarchaeota archaeon]